MIADKTHMVHETAMSSARRRFWLRKVGLWLIYPLSAGMKLVTLLLTAFSFRESPQLTSLYRLQYSRQRTQWSPAESKEQAT